MLALEYIRKNAAHVRECAERKGEDAAIVDQVLGVDEAWRGAQTQAETQRAQQNELSKEFGRTRDQALLPRMRELATSVKERMAAADELKADLDRLLLMVPNVYDASVPVGETEDDNVVIRHWGEKPAFDFQPRPHHELAPALGILDLERAARVSGARFAFLVGAGARLQRALIDFFLDLHTTEHGYTEVNPPYLVNSASMLGTANLPKFAEDAFRVEGYDLWLVPTAEVPVTNLHREEILDAAELPLRYVAFSPCFRSEAGSAGKDTRGYIRQHQFEKVELVKITTPETSMEEFEGLTADAEQALQRLGLHYRVKAMCTADMGFAQYKKYDLEAWAPGVERWLEVSSCSVFNDFQARRANLRYRPAPGEAPRFAHTINGSGLALLRTWTALLETYQQADGSVRIPDALKPFMRGLNQIGPPA
ncbi:MAG TPA: serine--tRNA ligase [Candidatus Dormibacteraeota bacterium]